MSNILVTGATGYLGKAVTESLLKKTGAANVHVLVRNAVKAAELAAKGLTVHVGSYDDYASLLSAFKNIDKVYMVSGNELDKRIQQQDNVVNAAKEAGVKHIVYTSFQRKNETASSPISFVGESHLNTETKIKASGITYTILQHGIYADMIPIFAGPQLLENFTIYLPAGEGKTAYALRTDQAEAGANILLDETGKYDNKSLEFSGPEPIVYVSPAADEFRANLTKAGVPAEIIGLTIGFSHAAEEGEFANISNEMEAVLGHKPVTVEAYLQSVYGSK
jgi:NAD(P)H dehydrogenase (quinone)